MELIVGGEHTHAATGGRPFDSDLPTVVLIHGAGMDGTVWQFQTRYFAHHGYSVLAVDLPGHGRSGGMPAFDVADSARWLGELLDVVGVTEASLVGHSMGGLVALRTAATQPDRVRRLVLLGVAERMPVNQDLLAAAERNDHLAYDLVASWSHAPPAHTGGHPTPGLWMMGSTVRLLERNRPGVLHADLSACHSYDSAGRDALEVRCPALLLLGGADQMTRPKIARPLAEAISDCRVVTLPGAGHMSLVERPNEVLDEIAGFLAGGG